MAEQQRKWPKTNEEWAMYHLVMDSLKRGEPVNMTDKLRRAMMPYIKEQNLGYFQDPLTGEEITVEEFEAKDAMEQTNHKPHVNVMRKCAYCNKSDTKLLRCGRCKTTYYCSKECQKPHWKKHKKVCKK